LESRIEYGYANGRTKADRIRTTGASEEAGKNNNYHKNRKKVKMLKKGLVIRKRVPTMVPRKRNTKVRDYKE
jgi:hypothetical protein